MKVEALETCYYEFVRRAKGTTFEYDGPPAACLRPVPPGAWPEAGAKKPQPAARAEPAPTGAGLDLRSLLE